MTLKALRLDVVEFGHYYKLIIWGLYLQCNLQDFPIFCSRGSLSSNKRWMDYS